MTRDAIEGLVRAWAPRLGLSHWEIEIAWDETLLPSEMANVVTESAYDGAFVTFNTDLVENRDAEYVEATVVHELVHIVMRDLDATLPPVLDLVPKGAAALARARYEHEIEGVVDRMAGVLVALSGARFGAPLHRG
jgi:hypothetical protein